MISEWDFRGGGYDYEIIWLSAYQVEVISPTRGRNIRMYSDPPIAYDECKLLLPYAPMMRTGGPCFTLFQHSVYTPFTVRDYFDTQSIVTVPVRGSWDFLAVTFQLVWNVGTAGTWRYYFRRGYWFN